MAELKQIPASGRYTILVLLLNVPSEQKKADLLQEIPKTFRGYWFHQLASLTYLVVAEYVDSFAATENLIRQHNPHVVHFKNANPADAPFFDGVSSDAKELSDFTQLAELFQTPGSRTECVVFENCYSPSRAQPLVDSVLCVLGVNGVAASLLDRFYRRRGDNLPYHACFSKAFEQYRYERGQQTGEPWIKPEEMPFFLSRGSSVLDQGEGEVSIGISLRQGGTEPLEAETQAVKYPVWFATNRKPINVDDISKGFSGESDSQVRYGTCSVVIPKSHKIGSLGSPWWQRFLTQTDDRLQVDWSSLAILAEDSYWHGLAQALAGLEYVSSSCLIYIHGFNVSFEAAALRAAQLGVDLKVEGATAFFSWPSYAHFKDYLPDTANVEASEQAIADFIGSFAQKTGCKHVNLIVHSMGNRGLLRAMQRIAADGRKKADLKITQIFLAAPDVDVRLFQDLAHLYHQMAEHTTLYASAKDFALASSGIIADYPRAGYVPPVTIIKNIDTIEVSDVDLSFLGHGYYGSARAVLADMHQLLRSTISPTRRGLISTRTSNGSVYWRMKG
jgi:esterase/lipase superfamily enzyme